MNRKVMAEVNSKTVTFVALMGALGNILFGLSNYLGPIVPGVSIDLSHIPTFIAALYGGPIVGLVTGFIVGLFPGIQYGPLSPFGSWVALIALPVGKSLTGFTAGLLCRILGVDRRNHKSLFTVPLILSSYVPECLFTIFYFVVLMPYLVGSGGIGILAFVLPKAWAEIAFMSIFMAALVGNNGFSLFIANHFSNQRIAKVVK
jgi:riboflavin transporter FmnP